MPLKIKNEQELAKYGIALNPSDPSQAVALETLQEGKEMERGKKPSAPEESEEFASEAPHEDGSLTRENSDADVPVASLADDILTQGLRAVSAEIAATDAKYPTLYHRLGTFIVEAEKRFGSARVLQMLREDGIDKTRASRSRQIAEVYTLEQVREFPSLRAILATLQITQAKTKRRPKAPGSVNRTQKPPTTGVGVPEGLDDGEEASRHGSGHRDHVAPLDTIENDLLDQFVQLGLEVLQRLGEEALKRAVEKINAYTIEPFEDAFEEV